ncbi:putative beta-lysine N-acetyltransferase [Caldalkalibacillus salinus]|uniref:putative beta-lysine N-acetyltransferase n=1 Tax=Caldalkalibacillus salinus TaxID=2803787 RepID=UPI0019219AD9|nr:putative beta-lysine N-acetyltransferase [Caldalkalibacillus salinus]
MLLTQDSPIELSSLGASVELDTHNRRVKVYEVSDDCDWPTIKDHLRQWALEHDCDKLMFFSTEENEHLQNEEECYKEGTIDRFFNGQDAYIYSIFLSDSRHQLVDAQQEDKVMSIVQNDDKQNHDKSTEELHLPEGYVMRPANEDDAEAMASLYDQVFQTYPTPMNDPSFVAKMMNDEVYFTIVEHNGELISSCSADVMKKYKAAEMTDCATLPEHRGKGLLSHQFTHLEKRMEEKGVNTLFSYTRAVSIGMNLINARNGYTFRGRLIQNSHISGRLEDMNIWVKTL